MPDFDLSASDDALSSPAELVEEWKNDNQPLTDRQAIAHWMASTLAQEGELFHRDAVDHIHGEHGLSTQLVGTTDSGGDSIDGTITDHFHKPFGTSSPKWIRGSDYSESKWVLTS